MNRPEGSQAGQVRGTGNNSVEAGVGGHGGSQTAEDCICRGLGSLGVQKPFRNAFLEDGWLGGSCLCRLLSIIPHLRRSTLLGGPAHDVKC